MCSRVAYWFIFWASLVHILGLRKTLIQTFNSHQLLYNSCSRLTSWENSHTNSRLSTRLTGAVCPSKNYQYRVSWRRHYTPLQLVCHHSRGQEWFVWRNITPVWGIYCSHCVRIIYLRITSATYKRIKRAVERRKATEEPCQVRQVYRSA